MSNLGSEARRLLDEARDALRPTAQDRDRIREALRARLGAESGLGADAPAPPAPATGAGGIGVAGFTTAVVVGLAIGGGLIARAFWPDSAESPTPVVSATPAVVASVPAEPVVPPEAPPRASPPVSSAAPKVNPAPAPRRSSDQLSEEVAILSRAQTELHAERFTAALRLLGEHERKFPRGTLAPERSAAKVRALCSLGRVAEADAELARLPPSSLHAERARAACRKR